MIDNSDKAEGGMNIFDRGLLRQRRDRTASGFADFSFVHDEIADRMIVLKDGRIV